MANKRRGLLRSPLVLGVALMTILALSGVVYAHWFTGATVEAHVSTGNVGAWWFAAFTDDDGIVNDWDIGDDNEGEIFDYWPGGFQPCDPEDPDDEPGGPNDCSSGPSSRDPNSIAAAGDDDRELKDVGGCWAWADGGETLNMQIHNAYPGYTCTSEGWLVAGGSIPIKTAGMFIDPDEFMKEYNCRWVGGGVDPWHGAVGERSGIPFADFGWGWGPGGENPDYNDVEPNGIADEGEFALEDVCDHSRLRVVEAGPGHLEVFDGRELELNLYLQDSCGVQADPWEDQEIAPETGVAKYRVSVHVKQDADQNANYWMSVHPRAVNWNEFDDSLCGVYYPPTTETTIPLTIVP
jgi:hypothetical protein